MPELRSVLLTSFAATTIAAATACKIASSVNSAAASAQTKNAAPTTCECAALVEPDARLEFPRASAAGSAGCRFAPKVTGYSAQDLTITIEAASDPGAFEIATREAVRGYVKVLDATRERLPGGEVYAATVLGSDGPARVGVAYVAATGLIAETVESGAEAPAAISGAEGPIPPYLPAILANAPSACRPRGS